MSLDVVRAGLVQRLRASGLAGDELAPVEQLRAGVLLVLCAWSAFVVAGCCFAKFSEHWQAVTPESARDLPATAFDVVLQAAELASAAVLLGIAVALSAFVAFLRDGGWQSIRRHILRATALTAVTLALSGLLVIWAHHLSHAERNGENWLYGTFFVLWGLFVAGSIALWTAAAVAAARRIHLAPRRLRLEAGIAWFVTAAMFVMTAGAALWWGSLAAAGGGHSAVQTVSPQLLAITLTMLLATSVAVAGSARSLNAVRALRSSSG